MNNDKIITRPNGAFMSGTIPRGPASDDMEKFFESIFPVIPKIVCKVCVNLGRNPNQTDIDEFAQRIGFLLWMNNYQVLCSFRRESSLETWLFTIAKRNILRWLREQNGIDSLESKLLDSYIVQPSQVEKLLLKERRKILQVASRKLPSRKQKLLGLWRQQLSRRETADEMGIKMKSVTVEKVKLVKMLKQIIKEGRGNGG